MLDAGSHLWSIRRSRANFLRATALLSGAAGAARWLADVCHWRSPATTILAHLLLVTFACFPELILPTAFLYASVAGAWSYLRQPRRPPQADAGCRAPRRPAPTSSTRRRTRSRRRGPTAWCARGTTGCGRWPGGSRRWSATWRRRGAGAVAAGVEGPEGDGGVHGGLPRRRRRGVRHAARWWRSSPGCTCSATRGSGAGCRRPPATSSRGCRPAPIPCYSI